MTSTEIQTIAALIQAATAVVFLVSVVYDASRRHWLREQERRDTLIKALQIEFIAAQVVRPKRRRDLLVRAKPNSLTLGLRRWACHGLTPFPAWGGGNVSSLARAKQRRGQPSIFRAPSRPAPQVETAPPPWFYFIARMATL